MGKINPYFSVKKNTFNVLLTSSQEFEKCVETKFEAAGYA